MRSFKLFGILWGKSSIVALAVLTVSAASFAQSTVTLYGVVDAGFINDGTDTKYAGTGVNGTSRLGFKGEEDLGGGLKAIFTVETGLNSGKETATYIGDRGAFVGIAGSFGTVTMGSSVLSPSFWARANTDASTTNNYSIAAFGGATRLDNSVNYTSPSFGGLTVRASMVQKADNAGNNATDLSVVYANGPLTLAASGSDSGTATGSFVGAAYNFGAAKVFVNQTDTTDKFTGVGISAPVGALTLQADYKMAKDADVNTYVLSAQYALSKRSSLTAFTSKADNADAKVGFGIRHNF